MLYAKAIASQDKALVTIKIILHQKMSNETQLFLENKTFFKTQLLSDEDKHCLQ